MLVIFQYFLLYPYKEYHILPSDYLHQTGMQTKEFMQYVYKDEDENLNIQILCHFLLD